MKRKTLQEQYNQIKNGKGSKEIFLKEAKKSFPNYIHNIATFNQAERILRQKSIISENIWGIATGKTEQPDWFSIFNENIDTINEEAKAVEKETSKEVTDLEENNFDYKDKDNVNNVYGEEFLKGYYTEMRNSKNVKKTEDELKSIVAKNLAKDQLHYVKKGQFGVDGLGYEEKEIEEVSGKFKSSGYSDKLKKSIKENYSEFQRVDKGEKDVAAKDKAEEEVFGAGVEKGEKIEKSKKKKPKKETIETKLAEIDKASQSVALEAKIEALAEIIESKTQRLSMVSEDENLSELMDKKKIKEMQREIKLLEKRKAGFEKLYEKSCGSKYQKQEIVGEVTEEEEITESKRK